MILPKALPLAETSKYVVDMVVLLCVGCMGQLLEEKKSLYGSPGRFVKRANF